ncbi:TAT-variant-translocated molybdopterin oxidoreductase [Gangjinia marincola]|uniref:TAT-variant-translocated molybdopterin oxidoreductase n=1 Tax=Gangjinia marincola TaxID=578463 RepID=A0ABP3XQD2_9FLAO
MSSTKKYWKSVEELNPDSKIAEGLAQNEFTTPIPTDEFLGDKETLENSNTSRRDFLKYVGFSTAAASLAACEGPVIKSIPYVVQPERIVPGISNMYATTMTDGYDFASVLVKSREGRPIQIQKNDLASQTAMPNARVFASVLGLYDKNRIQRPMISGEEVAWTKFDEEVKKELDQLGGKELVILTNSMSSPSTTKLIKEFKENYSNSRHVVYDAIAEDAALNAFQSKYGKRALASYDFEKAEVIVSVGADFLGDWQGGGFAQGYSAGRVPKKGKMSRHIQFESNMTLSGANADKRVPLTPTEQKVALASLYGYVVGGSYAKLPQKLDEAVKQAASELKKAGSEAVVVSGIDDQDAQSLVLAINEFLASKAMDTQNPRTTRQGNAKAVAKLVNDMNAGKVGGLMMAGVNPVYAFPNTKMFAEGLKKVGFAVDFTMSADETALQCKYVAATPHYLESWGDVQMTANNYSLMQPTIKPLFDTKQFQDCLLKWSDKDQTYYNYIKENWKGKLGTTSFNKALQDGVFEYKGEVAETSTSDASEETSTVASTSSLSMGSAARKLSSASKSNGFELTLYSNAALGNGQQANNPWLQEMPDPITRASWDNYVTMSRADAEKMDLLNEYVADGAVNGGYVTIKAGSVTVSNVPVMVQPGQARGTIGLALGYGRKEGIQLEMQTGVNAYPLYKDFDRVQTVTLQKEEGTHEFACVQLQNTLMGRGDIIKETTLKQYKEQPKEEWNKVPEVSLNHIETAVTSPEVDLWDSFDRSIGHHFNMGIDLNACTGCGACVIACHAENNVPVVGKREIRKSRDMHWLRIDRYYSAEESFDLDNNKKHGFDGLSDNLSGFGELERPDDNPQVAFQPVMCQHCNHAPCETVCPVAASAHGRQGQNHMTYNRCVGTRYCANNCPYKVRRFNWFLYNQNDEFDYHMNNDLGRMVINPDVTVRSRGVMEKCSMCIQMTQRQILDAKLDGRVIKDGEFATACSAACPSNAISFGDINDKDSRVYKEKESDRMYHLLEHVGTKPNVFYHVKVRNTAEV